MEGAGVDLSATYTRRAAGSSNPTGHPPGEKVQSIHPSSSLPWGQHRRHHPSASHPPRSGRGRTTSTTTRPSCTDTPSRRGLRTAQQPQTGAGSRTPLLSYPPQHCRSRCGNLASVVVVSKGAAAERNPRNPRSVLHNHER